MPILVNSRFVVNYMGSYQSSVEIPGGGNEGYHVLKVQEGSPGAEAGLEAYFDFIISIGNTRLVL